MSIYDLNTGINKLDNSEKYWVSLVQKSNFEFGVMKLEVGRLDTQNPHSSDEVYYIIEGDGFINIDGEDHSIKQGSIIYVPKATKHHFHGHTKDLVIFYALN